MMFGLVVMALLWPAVALAQDAGGLPMPDTWWGLVFGVSGLFLSGGAGGAAFLSRMRQGGAVGADTDITARIKAIEDAGRAAAEQSATAERDKRLSELEAKVTSLSAETATLRAMVSQASERTTAGLDSVAASLKRLEGGG